LCRGIEHWNSSQYHLDEALNNSEKTVMLHLHESNSYFSSWKRAVEQLLKLNYAISTEYTGLSDHDLRTHSEQRKNPKDFVDWLAKKYDLVSTTSIYCYLPEASP